jgi:replicative DNA helicase
MTPQAPQLPRVHANLEAERAVLGASINNPEAFAIVAELMKPEHFSAPAHYSIFCEMQRLDSKREPIDLVVLATTLAADPNLQAMGGAGYLGELLNSRTRVANIEHYAKLVIEAANLRRVQNLAHRTAMDVEDRSNGKTVNELLTSLESETSKIRETYAVTERTALPLRQIVDDLVPTLERMWSGKGLMLGSTTGYSDLDRLISGWQPGGYALLGARPSCGKSALACEFAVNQAKQGNSVAFYSLEMSRDLMLMRIACRQARVNYQRLTAGTLGREARDNFTRVLADVRQLPIWIDDRTAVRASDLRWRLRSLAQRQNIKFAVVDYLQLLRADGDGRYEQVTKVSLEMQAIAKELGQISGGSLLVVAQLNRVAAGDRPQLHHFRDSGQIEQDADIAMLLSDEEPTKNGQADLSMKRLEVAKQRNGPCDSVRLIFLPAFMGFEEAVRN